MEHPSAPAPRPSEKRKWLPMLLKIAIPAVVSVGLCVVMFRDIDFGAMMAIIRRDCRFEWIALNLAIGLLPMFFRAMRWRLQLRVIGCRPPLRVLVYSMFGTYAVNLVFPRLGEVWRTGYIAGREGTPFPAVFGSMVADRLADTCTVALLTLFTFIIASGPLTDFVREYPDAYRAISAVLSSPWTWGAVAAFILLAWLFMKRGNGGLSLKIKGFFRGLWEGFAAIARMDHKGAWLLYTAGVWGCYFLQLYVAFRAFPMTDGILERYGAVAPLVCFVLTSISMGVPSNGGIGPYQATMIFGLSVFAPAAALAAGPAREAFLTEAAAFGNLLIGAQTLFWVICGLVVFGLIAIDKRRG